MAFRSRLRGLGRRFRRVRFRRPRFSKFTFRRSRRLRRSRSRSKRGFQIFGLSGMTLLMIAAALYLFVTPVKNFVNRLLGKK